MEAEPSYALSRSSQSSIRLNLQHYVISTLLGYLIHPSIPTYCDYKAKIADLGTGTGLWALEMAHWSVLFPRAQFYGFDVSSAQFPEHVPDNVSFHVLDSLNEDIPEHLMGQFDIVHIRLFVAAIRDGNPSKVLKHALKLLKPGGYLQWVEFDIPRHEIRGPHGREAPELTKLAHFMQDIAADLSWVANLPKTFESHGLENVQWTSKRELAWQRTMVSENACAVVSEVLEKAGPELRERASKLGVNVEQAYKEVEAGGYWSTPVCVAVGMKPRRDAKAKTDESGLSEFDLALKALDLAAKVNGLEPLTTQTTVPTVEAAQPQQLRGQRGRGKRGKTFSTRGKGPNRNKNSSFVSAEQGEVGEESSFFSKPSTETKSAWSNTAVASNRAESVPKVNGYLPVAGTADRASDRAANTGQRALSDGPIIVNGDED